jgi:hypothetical protein
VHTRIFRVHSINWSCVEIWLEISLSNAVIFQVPLPDFQSSLLAFAKRDTDAWRGEDDKS